MLPTELFSSFLEYKVDTNKFVAWLCQVSADHGYELPDSNGNATSTSNLPTSTIRLKGKARRLGKEKAAAEEASKDAAPIIVTTRMLVDQAKYLSYIRPTVKVPFRMQSLLSSAIQRRRRCALFFAEKDTEGAHVSPQERLSLATHNFFIKCLEDIQEFLRLGFEQSRVSVPITNADLDHGHTKDQVSFTNRFESLHMDKSDVEEALHEDLPTIEKASNKQKQTPPKKVYELDQRSDADICYMVWCFFDYLNDLELFLLPKWDEVEAGSKDFTSVALLTHVALELVRHGEEELMKLIPEERQAKSATPYGCLLRYLFQKENLTDDDGFRSNFFVYYQEFRMLQFNWLGDIPGGPRPTIEFQQSDELPLDWDLRNFYVNAMKIDTDLIRSAYENGKNGETFEPTPYHPATEGSFPRYAQTYRDNVLKSFMEVVHEKKIHARSCFLARLNCGIGEVFGPKSRNCYTKLRQEGLQAHLLLQVDLGDFSKKMKSKGFWSTVNELSTVWMSKKAAMQALASADLIDRAIKNNFVASWKRVFLEQRGIKWDRPCTYDKCRIPDTHTDCRNPMENPVWWHENNPIYCYIESLRLSLSMDQTGVFQYLQGLEILSVAHIYNMVKQLRGEFEHPWADLEAAMAKFISPIFRGSFPKEPDEIYRRFLICTGVKASNFAPTARSSTIKTMKEKIDNRKHNRTWAVEVTPISEPLKQYLDCTMGAMELLKAAYVHQDPKKPTKHMCHFELLEGLYRNLDNSLDQIRFDWITLNRECRALLDILCDYIITRGDMGGRSLGIAEILIKWLSGGNYANILPDQSTEASTRFRKQGLDDVFFIINAFTKTLPMPKQGDDPGLGWSVHDATRLFGSTLDEIKKLMKNGTEKDGIDEDEIQKDETDKTGAAVEMDKFELFNISSDEDDVAVSNNVNVVSNNDDAKTD